MMVMRRKPSADDDPQRPGAALDRLHAGRVRAGGRGRAPLAQEHGRGVLLGRGEGRHRGGRHRRPGVNGERD